MRARVHPRHAHQTSNNGGRGGAAHDVAGAHQRQGLVQGQGQALHQLLGHGKHGQVGRGAEGERARGRRRVHGGGRARPQAAHQELVPPTSRQRFHQGLLAVVHDKQLVQQRLGLLGVHALGGHDVGGKRVHVPGQQRRVRRGYDDGNVEVPGDFQVPLKVVGLEGRGPVQDVVQGQGQAGQGLVREAAPGVVLQANEGLEHLGGVLVEDHLPGQGALHVAARRVRAVRQHHRRLQRGQVRQQGRDQGRAPRLSRRVDDNHRVLHPRQIPGGDVQVCEAVGGSDDGHGAVAVVCVWPVKRQGRPSQRTAHLGFFFTGAVPPHAPPQPLGPPVGA